jgi:hypothetical protein
VARSFKGRIGLQTPVSNVTTKRLVLPCCLGMPPYPPSPTPCKMSRASTSIFTHLNTPLLQNKKLSFEFDITANPLLQTITLQLFLGRSKHACPSLLHTNLSASRTLPHTLPHACPSLCHILCSRATIELTAQIINIHEIVDSSGLILSLSIRTTNI